MRKLAFLIAALALPSAALAKLGPLLSPVELVRAQSETNVAILHIRDDGFGSNEKDEFVVGHIAGAVNIPYAQFRTSKTILAL